MFFQSRFYSSITRWGLVAIVFSLGILLGIRITGPVEAASPQSSTNKAAAQVQAMQAAVSLLLAEEEEELIYRIYLPFAANLTVCVRCE